LPSIRAERGTLRADRGDFDFVELAAPDALPQKPDRLTAAGEEVWIDDIGRAARDGAARARLQSHACREHHRTQTADRGDADIDRRS
jgi:hypothetical protein